MSGPGGGETKADVSAWTVDSLKAHIEQVVAEVDRRYEQRFVAQEKAVLTALIAQKEAVTSAMTAAEKAVEKAETQAKEWRAQANEWRSTMSDREARFVTQDSFTALAEKVHDISARIDRTAGQSTGLRDAWAVLLGAAGLVASIIAIAYAVTR